MKKIISFIFIGLSLIMVPLMAMATDFGEVADKLETPMLIITKLLLFACYVVGAILIFTAIAQYRNHRASPKLVPLTTPIMLLVLGVCLMLVPYFTSLGQESASLAEQQKREGRDDSRATGILGTPSRSNGGDLGPGSMPDDDPEEPYVPPSGGGGHWSDSY